MKKSREKLKKASRSSRSPRATGGASQDVPSDASFRAVIRDTKDGLPLATSDRDKELAVVKRTWKMALDWARGRLGPESTAVLVGRTFTGAELLERLGFPRGFTVSVRVPGGGDWSNTDLEVDDDTLLSVRDRRHREEPVAACPDRTDGGPHEYSADLEYDSSGRTVNCEHCGEAP